MCFLTKYAEDDIVVSTWKYFARRVVKEKAHANIDF